MIFLFPPQLLAVFMQLDTRSLLMNYIDLMQTKDVQLIFDALLVRPSSELIQVYLYNIFDTCKPYVI